MDLTKLFIECLWVGLFSGGLAVLLTAPGKYILPAFICGFTGKLVLKLLMSIELSQNWSTVFATCSIILLSSILLYRDKVSPVVIITGIIPLGATVAIMNVIVGLIKVSTSSGDMLDQSSISLIANIGKVFTTNVSIVFGLVTGLGIVNRIAGKKSDPVWKVSHQKK